MAPSKEWMNLNYGDEYEAGVETFLDYAFNKLGTTTIRCPCVKCLNVGSGCREDVQAHLLQYGIVKRYTLWYHHGENLEDSDTDDDSDGSSDYDEPFSDEMGGLLRDLYPEHDSDESENMNSPEQPNDEAKSFYHMLDESQQVVYDGCRISRMSAMVKLLHIKTLGRWSNESFTMLLEFLKDQLLPAGSNLPDSFYEAKKTLRELGLSYQKIDSCVHDCMLFWKEDKDLDRCKICDESRWKVDKRNGTEKLKANGKRKPLKTLRYFPLKPRLQRLYMCSKTASLMTWHHDKRKKDGVLRHPADALAWRSFDDTNQDFALEPRNVRLGLASDGFVPFANAKISHSIWPVILIPYNLPPELCMRESNLILSMLVPGPNGPGDAIDIYLQPLIEELKELWYSGVKTFDASVQRHFQLHAAVIWTINDLPAYAILSGWSTKGRMACPSCLTDTCYKRLDEGGKECYIGHRRYLPLNHRWRKHGEHFDGTNETRQARTEPFSMEELLLQMQDLQGITLTNAPHKKVAIDHLSRRDNWNKISIFNELPYWGDLKLHHNLDVMHIEKNICDSIVGTIMDIKGKTKDTLKARLDLQKMKIRPELHPIDVGNKQLKMPDALYTLSSAEKQIFCQFLKDLKVPDGFSSNISYCVNMKEAKLMGLKSHDCHVILEYLLPVAIRGLLTPDIREALIELSTFFNILCSKSVKVADLEQIDAQIPITLCKLEKIFPPAFFTISMHLPIHLAKEALLGGPVHCRYMYPIEQQMFKYKSYIRNRACPEASIAEGSLAEECMNMCSRYLHTVKTKFNRPDRNCAGSTESNKGLAIFNQPGRHLGAQKFRDVDKREMDLAHTYLLQNCDKLTPFWKEYSNSGQASSGVKFSCWFKEKMAKLYETTKNSETEELLSLSRGPTQYATSFSGYIVNGCRFHVEDREKILRTQNSGVVVTAKTDAGADNIDFYGVLIDILELQYLGGRRVVLFRCKWWDVFDKIRGVKEDRFGFVSLNFKRQLKINEPFILASQAHQVFYVPDNVNKGWHVVVKSQPYNADDEVDSISDYEEEAFEHPDQLAFVESTSTSDGVNGTGKRMDGTSKRRRI